MDHPGAGMSLITTSREELLDRTEVAFTRFRELVADVPADIRVGDGTWLTSDVARHVVTVFRRYTERPWRSREGLSATVPEVTALNHADVEALATLPRADLLDALDTEWEKYRALDITVDNTFPFHFGATIDGAGALGNMLAELLIHGYDTATAAHRSWPIEDRDALLVLNAAFQIAPFLVNPERTARVRSVVEFRIGAGHPQVITIDRAHARIEDAAAVGGRRDAIVAGPAAVVLLNLYPRIGRVAATRRGVRLRGGRRPWVLVQFPNWFLVP